MADPHNGRLAELWYDLDGVSTYTKILGRTDCTFDVSMAMLDATDADSGAGREFIPDRYTGTVDVNCLFEESDTSQEAIRDAFVAGTNLYWQYRPKGTGSGLNQYAFRGYVNKFTPATPNGAMATLSFGIQITGALTLTDQS